MEDSIKKIIMNFEKSSQQLGLALETMEEFSNKLSESFDVSKTVQDAVEKANAIDFGEARDLAEEMKEIALKVKKNIEGVTKALSLCTEEINLSQQKIGDCLKMFNETRTQYITIADDVEKSVRHNKDVFQTEIDTINEKLDLIIEKIQVTNPELELEDEIEIAGEAIDEVL